MYINANIKNDLNILYFLLFQILDKKNKALYILYSFFELLSFFFNCFINDLGKK